MPSGMFMVEQGMMCMAWSQEHLKSCAHFAVPFAQHRGIPSACFARVSRVHVVLWPQNLLAWEVFKGKAKSESVVQYDVSSSACPTLPLSWHIHRVGPATSSASCFTGQIVLVPLYVAQASISLATVENINKD
jgi:hypothetical protein